MSTDEVADTRDQPKWVDELDERRLRGDGEIQTPRIYSSAAKQSGMS